MLAATRHGSKVMRSAVTRSAVRALVTPPQSGKWIDKELGYDT